MTENNEIPTNLSNLKRELEAGRCFMAQFRTRRLYFDFVDEVGWIRTETDGDGRNPVTTSAGNSEFEAAVAYADIVEVDREEIPVEKEEDR